MFENSLDRLPNSKENLFIFRKNTFKKFNIKKIFLQSKVLKNFYLIEKKKKEWQKQFYMQEIVFL